VKFVENAKKKVNEYSFLAKTDAIDGLHSQRIQNKRLLLW